ncbi:uncharacterized protein DUF4148 [Pseudoduganella lurida]|uniref:Uncharacterized protein DUF4148 n=1 Tax=Pseudoduganella lurida TaxID=1036180 RepID=A0A562R9Z4_9BURK|nr:DUF4148 domain-containing protein [Pseudoduganella lurida]TWI65230.1 uncharacterized protein DUF4148 [Pseudoduganella lurida]
MKTAYFLIAGLALATAGAAFAAGSGADDAPAAASQPAAHQLTRAEVQAQVIEARRNGTLIETEADMDIAQTRNQRSR